jgi:hypothetical protein
MNRSYSKIRHIKESNILLEQRKMMLMEQDGQKKTLGKLFDKYYVERSTELRLPDGNGDYVKNSFDWGIFDEYFESKGITPPTRVFINNVEIKRKK